MGMRIAAAAFLLGMFACGGCRVGVTMTYGFTGEQKEDGMTVSCPRCGSASEIDKGRMGNLLPWVPGYPLMPWTHNYYCHGCGTWWNNKGFSWVQYEHHPGWPWTSK